MSKVISSIAGTRNEPKDSYVFVRGTTAIFKIIFTNNGISTKVDTSTIPKAFILKPGFLSAQGALVPETVAILDGILTVGQEFEYSFIWDIPSDTTSSDEWIISYQGILGGNILNFGDEFFTISAIAGMIGTKVPSYATVDDVRKKKFNIDTYLPEAFRKDLDSRNSLIEDHLQDATVKLREELALHRQRGNTENYRLFCIYYTIWSLMMASKGEDGSAVADQNILFWRNEWESILKQEKRKSVPQGLSLGRS